MIFDLTERFGSADFTGSIEVAMAHPTGESNYWPLGLGFDHRVVAQFRGSVLTYHTAGISLAKLTTGSG